MESPVLGMVAAAAVFLGGLYVFWGPSYSKKRNTKDSIQATGLYNLGNTCFMNAILQALASLPSFVQWVESGHWQLKPLGRELASLVSALSHGSNSANVLSASPVMNALRMHGWVITSEQQDAHEFFQVLSSTLDEEMGELSSVLSLGDVSAVECEPGYMAYYEMYGGTRNPEQPEWIKILLVSLQKNTNKVHIPFRGLFASQLTCKQCKMKCPVKFDGYESISLSLPQYFQVGLTLEDLLHKFVCCEVVDAVECKSCMTSDEARQTKSKFVKRLTIGKLPQCLCVHIQRTYWHSNRIPYKNGVHIKFPEVLDMKPYVYNGMNYGTRRSLRGGTRDGNVAMLQPELAVRALREKWGPLVGEGNGYSDGHQSLFATGKGSCDGFRSCYNLMAVIVHLGDVEDGHYVTYRRFSPSPGSAENPTGWLYASDELVETASLGQVMSCSAYMLLYEKSSHVE